MNKYMLRVSRLVLILLGILCFVATQTYGASYTLVKTIDLNPLVGDDGSIEVDVVGNELYVANWIQDKYFRIDPVTGMVLGSFSLGNGILIDNHGSEYDPTRGLLIHASDSRGWHQDPPGYDAFFMTDTGGNLVNGPYKLFGPDGVSANPEGLTVDTLTGRIWVSTVTTYDGIFEINPNDGTILNHIDIGGSAWALGFNPNTRKLLFADYYGVIWEIATDGTGLAKVFDPGVGPIFGMAFTPTGDLVLLDYGDPDHGIPLPSQLLLYDSSDDADNVFTASVPVAIDIKPGSDPNSINPNSKGKIPVAILSTEDFDAPSQVNQDSLTFGRTGIEKSLAFCHRKPKDVYHDGLKDDVVCHFFTEYAGFECGDTEAILKGQTTGGMPIEGRDSVRINPCK